ncbi:MAG: transketolase [Clostridiales bacterium]|mgnify:CR=1 FL=1|nr:transketolase [Clostridiales bacterium]
MNTHDKDLRDLRLMAARLRRNILLMVPPGKVGHLGGSSSVADITAALYFHHMKVFPDPRDPRRDRCVFSKGHAVLAQYAALGELGYFDKAEFARVKTLKGVLQGHPDMDYTPGIEAVTGSLGQGLSICLGMALGLRLDGSPARVYCVLGDGELAEGQVWEAVMAAGAFGVDNLCAIIDQNGLQATDSCEAILPNPDQATKWAAFGWHTLEIDGHDLHQVVEALETARATRGRPTVIVANTVKGKGFPFAEGRVAFHNAALNEEQYQQALAAVEQMMQEAAQ